MLHKFTNAFLVILLFCSCTTLRSRKLDKVPEDEAIQRISATIASLCSSNNNPQFLADINSSNFRVPSFQLEAIWENKFNRLKGSVIGPLGEEYSSFEVNKNKIDYTFQTEAILDTDSLNQMTSLFAKIGSKNLREFICGGYAFKKINSNDGIFVEAKEDEKNKIYTEQDLKPIENKRQYIAISTVKISDNEIEVQSNLSLERKGLGYTLVMNSQFYYGLFSNETDVYVRWAGYVLADNIYPSELTFRIGSDVYTINLSEYQ
ncbi:hypothetical protein [Fluviispira sanaruensis]|uniref:Lipoprotein n=1 Tax=Fluviispira sanaruensis TaxID=2493639 RepID=A0A4P2VX38_FLUSA|nr:hypothetical protein [Fluviispira sanaruensis]BBH54195.1 hypothetical protein JCM31447_26550 [Fluviispira sanaruensis]